MADAGAMRIEVPAALASKIEDEDFFEKMGDVSFSSTRRAKGDLWIWVERENLEPALAALARAGATGLSTFEEKTTDWVAESAGLRKAVLVERYLLDPHDDQLATPQPPGIRRLFLPAVRASGPGPMNPRASRSACSSRRTCAARASSTWAAEPGCSRSSPRSKAHATSWLSTSTLTPPSRRASRRARTGFRASPRSPVSSRRSVTRLGSTSSSRT